MTEPIEVRIEKLVYGGEGLARHEGQAVFAPFVLPGETVKVEPVERRKKFIRGRLASVTQPSSERIAAECPHFGVCGGCDYQHIPYEAQLRYKSEILRETLSRLGKVIWEGEITTHASPPYGYRNRAQWKIAPGPGGRRALGYFQAGTRRLCAVNVCPILSPRLRETLGVFSRLTDAGALPAGLREVEAFADDADDKVMLNLSFDALDDSVTAVTNVIRAELPGAESFLLHIARGDRFELDGPGYLTYGVGAHRYRVGHLSFFQVNRALLPELIDLAMADARGRLALDLFAGVGLFSRAAGAPLRARGGRRIQRSHGSRSGGKSSGQRSSLARRAE